MSLSNTEQAVKDIRRHTRRKYFTEGKIRIVLDGLRGESSIAEICRREGINSNRYYRWSKDFLEAGKKRLSGDTVRLGQTWRGRGSTKRPRWSNRAQRLRGPTKSFQSPHSWAKRQRHRQEQEYRVLKFL